MNVDRGSRIPRRHSSCYHVGYSLNCNEYDDLRGLAAGRCMMCSEATARLYIDHDHQLGTWAVRGLICHTCNQGLRYVDAGTRHAGPEVNEYLARAWHRDQPTSAAKQARSRKRVACPTCGRDTAIKRDGSLFRHWSRLSGPTRYRDASVDAGPRIIRH
ncbi:endonuclease domain-containing protein [Kitasatospora sp. NPDC048239]|uniref:endonuclease domain-containing protein n=1 Tax=Kitasatospora sp. NPDC048239 TaxID=3364046 RepID=UPI0037146C52